MEPLREAPSLPDDYIKLARLWFLFLNWLIPLFLNELR